MKQPSPPQKFAVFDIDGTVIRWQLYHAIVDELGRRNCLSPIDHQKIIDARQTWKSRKSSNSFSDYEATLVHVYHHALSQITVEDYMQAVETVFEMYKDQVYTYTRDLIKKLKAKDYFLLAISGSQQEIIEKLGAYYGFDAVVGATYEQTEGHFTGDRTTTYGRKDIVLKELIDRYNLSVESSIAVGDSESDIAMLAMVKRPIAFNPSKGLFDEAQRQGWNIVIERKNVTYELERYGTGYQLRS